MIADARTYLADLVATLGKQWPGNRTVNIVCHGHSVPAGYFATPAVDTFHAYPRLLHQRLAERFPYAVTNVIVTAIGGEGSVGGAARFDADVLNHRPDLVAIDYGLNDRRLPAGQAADAWKSMISRSLDAGARVLLLTPTMDVTRLKDDAESRQGWRLLVEQADRIRTHAAEFGVGLVDSFAEFERAIAAGSHLTDLLSWSNHPNSAGHELVATAIMRWFAYS